MENLIMNIGVNSPHDKYSLTFKCVENSYVKSQKLDN